MQMFFMRADVYVFINRTRILQEEMALRTWALFVQLSHPEKAIR